MSYSKDQWQEIERQEAEEEDRKAENEENKLQAILNKQTDKIDYKALIETIAKTMVTIALNANDTLFQFGDDITTCEDLGGCLARLGVNEDIIENFFELPCNEKEYAAWLARVKGE